MLFASFGGGNKEDSFFRNPSPAHRAERLREDLFENTDLDDSTMVNALTNCMDEAAGRLTAPLVSDVRTASVSGWNNADDLRAITSTPRSNTILLVPDSDDES